jgi:hypothetical protein
MHFYNLDVDHLDCLQQPSGRCRQCSRVASCRERDRRDWCYVHLPGRTGAVRRHGADQRRARHVHEQPRRGRDVPVLVQRRLWRVGADELLFLDGCAGGGDMHDGRVDDAQGRACDELLAAAGRGHV